MKVIIVLAALALLMGAASAVVTPTLADCRVNMGAAQDQCNKCYSKYSSTARRTTCFNCLVNLRGHANADLDDCWAANDDQCNVFTFLDFCAVYNQCTGQRCFDCLTNFANKPDDVMDLCKMVEPLFDIVLPKNTVAPNLAFDCLSNTQGYSTPGYKSVQNVFQIKTFSELRTSPCLPFLGDKGPTFCRTPDCFYCLTNSYNSARTDTARSALFSKCYSCQNSSNFWGCVSSR